VDRVGQEQEYCRAVWAEVRSLSLSLALACDEGVLQAHA
jgi:hypothetical protein